MELTRYASRSVTLAIDLINSYSPVWDREDLPDERALAGFLADHGVADGEPVTRKDLESVRQIRGRLRQVFMAPDEGTAVAALNSILAEAGPLPHLARHDAGGWHLHFISRNPALSARVAAAAATALAVVIANYGFGRLRVCEGQKCLDVFVDLSRNRSRRYCSPAICGNRASVAAYRARQRAAKSSRPTD